MELITRSRVKPVSARTAAQSGNASPKMIERAAIATLTTSEATMLNVAFALPALAILTALTT
jgi:hypothetical protein